MDVSGIDRRAGAAFQWAMPERKQSEPENRQDGEPAKMELSPGVKLLRTLEGHGGRTVYCLAVSPDGEILASGGGDGRVKLWNSDSGELRFALEGHTAAVQSVAFAPDGCLLASGAQDGGVKLWETATGRLICSLQDHRATICSIAFDPKGTTLATGSADNTIKLWDVPTKKLVRTLMGHTNTVYGVAFGMSGSVLASGSHDTTVKLWDSASGRLTRTLEGHEGTVYSVAFDPSGLTLVSGGYDGTVKLWDPVRGRLVRTLEEVSGLIESMCYSPDGRLFAFKTAFGRVRLRRCADWELSAVITEPTNDNRWIQGITFHPFKPVLFTVGSPPGTPYYESSRLIHLWELDLGVLLGRDRAARPFAPAVHHTTAKIVLVGDSGVGKTGLGWRLAHGEFKEHASTHGQQFWVMPQLGTRRRDGTECEAILWDLAGQPDYRLIHALFLDDADLALVLFDPTDTRDPLHGVEFWLRQLRVEQASRLSPSSSPDSVRDRRDACPTLLVAARADCGTPTLTDEELQAFCQQRGLRGYVRTSAKAGEGLADLIERMKGLIPWEDKPAVTTEIIFKRVKDFVLELKENLAGQPVVVSWPELREQLERHFAKLAGAASVAQAFEPAVSPTFQSAGRPANPRASVVETPAGLKTRATADSKVGATLPPDWPFTDAEMQTAVGHLENYGYVRRLRTSKGEERVLLKPELLNNLAASFVLEARRNPKGLGALEEKRLLVGEYRFPELAGLSPAEQDILVDAAALLFLERHVCFREQTLDGLAYVVFPELINLKMPLVEETDPVVDGVAYTVSGAVENVYASLVVLLGYTQTFTRTAQWKAQARYEVSGGAVCGFRQEAEREGELDFVLYFYAKVGPPVRTLFQGLFECFLMRWDLTVLRFEPVVCAKGHALNRSVVREQLASKAEVAFCSKCGAQVSLPRAHEPIQLTRQQQAEVEAQRRVADQRTRFEQAVFRVQAYVKDQQIKAPECFISYAWGEPKHERWVEKQLAKDLQKAGLEVVLDRWHNAQIGASVARFIERIEKSDRIIMVGTPLYRRKYENKESATGYVVAAEVDLIANRLLGTEPQKASVIPLLLAGEKTTSLPPLLHGRVYADFRNSEAYFRTAFDLILSLYQLPPNHLAVADLRESLALEGFGRGE